MATVSVQMNAAKKSSPAGARACVAVLRVSGAGSVRVNGDYQEDGKCDKKPRYKKIGDEGMEIYWSGNWIFGENWAVYSNSQDTMRPPAHGWEDMNDGKPPGPTITYLASL